MQVRSSDPDGEAAPVGALGAGTSEDGPLARVDGPGVTGRAAGPVVHAQTVTRQAAATALRVSVFRVTSSTVSGRAARRPAADEGVNAR